MMKHVKKLILTLLVPALLVSGLWVGAFSDVGYNDYYSKAAKALNTMGIISGYGDGSFAPAKPITRAEMAAIICRMLGKENDAAAAKGTTDFSDVPDFHWASGYVNLAGKLDIINGDGNGSFRPADPVRHEEAIKMVVCALHLELLNAEGGWAAPYLKTAEESGLSGEMRSITGKNTTRGDVAVLVYKAVYLSKSTVTVAGKDYYLGMSEQQLQLQAGAPDDVCPSINGYTWQVFGADAYTGLLTAGLMDGRVVALGAAGTDFSYDGCISGGRLMLAPATPLAELEVGEDVNDEERFHCIFMADTSFRNAEKLTDAAMAGECRVNFHLVNAFRKMHGLNVLQWDSRAEAAAREHSRDMAVRDYFEHTNPEGLRPWDRMEKQGIRYSYAAENIAAGQRNAYDLHIGWVNSTGHRKNILHANMTHLGVGGAFSTVSKYKRFFTQNFFSP